MGVRFNAREMTNGRKARCARTINARAHKARRRARPATKHGYVAGALRIHLWLASGNLTEGTGGVHTPRRLWRQAWAITPGSGRSRRLTDFKEN